MRDNKGTDPSNPAALAALLAGDAANAAVASTPGGIEAQEAAGQRTMCAKAILPKFASFNEPINRDEYTALGITFGPDHDDLFVCVTLPDGWQVVPTEHSMWSNLVDSFGRERASIFYKAALYDRRAHIRLSRDSDGVEA